MQLLWLNRFKVIHQSRIDNIAESIKNQLEKKKEKNNNNVSSIQSDSSSNS